MLLDVGFSYSKSAFSNTTKAIKDVPGREYWPVLFSFPLCELRIHIDQTLAGPKTWFAKMREKDEVEMLVSS